MSVPTRITFVIAVALFTAGQAQAAERTVTLDVKNVSCVTCAPIVKRALTQVRGVSRVVVKEGDGGVAVATVTFDDAQANPNALAQASTNAGYPARAGELSGR